ncbi:unnamed protein product [Cochlearia groenlandica]
MEEEIQDWELLHSSKSNPADKKSKSLEEIGDVTTQGMITYDYFSVENNKSLCRVETNVDDRSEDGSVQSGSPGWIEPPCSDTPYGPKHYSELWSDTSSDRLDDVNNDLGLEKFGRNEMGIVDLGLENDLQRDLGEDESSLSGEVVSGNDHNIVGEEESVYDDSCVESEGGGGGGGEGEKGFMWWKIPIDVLKYCVLRVNPIWSFSVAAAVLGLVMLGRRLYNMKKKTRTLQLKVLLDDKKVVNHAAARWNEAISVVKRVPIIRPALPSPVAMNQWSMMS